MRLLGCYLFLLGVCRVGLSDVLVLDTGRVEGKIVRETEKEIRIQTTAGELVFSRSRVKQIERGPTLREQYEEKLRSVPQDDPEEIYKLALWCEERHMTTESRELLREVLDLDPDHAGAKKKLGLAAPKRAEQQAAEAEAAWCARLRGLLSRLESSSAREGALTALRGIEEAEAGRAALTLLPEYKEALSLKRVALIQVLAQTGCKDATSAVVQQLMKDEKEPVAQAAAAALPKLDRELAAELLVPLLKRNMSEASMKLCYPEKRAKLTRAIRRATMGLVGLDYPELAPILIDALYVRLPGSTDPSSKPSFMASAVESEFVSAGGNQTTVFSFSSPDASLESETYLNEVALAYLKRLSGQDFSYDKEPWRRWWVEHKHLYLPMP